MADELCMFGSDALYVPGMKVTHPRSIATFPCVLRRAVREEKRISLAEAIRKLTGMPAEVYRLAGKGRIQTGMDADLTLFDAAKITDHATYTQPLLPNEGIRRNACKKPSKTFSIAPNADPDTPAAEHSMGFNLGNINATAKNRVGYNRHSGQANYLFVDGHVESRQGSQIQFLKSGDPEITSYW